MRVAVYYSNSDIRIEQRPRPTAGPGELLLRVEACGICGSDVMEWYRKPRAPLVLGHEVTGVVEAAGAGTTGFRPGDRVVTTHHVPCGRCRYCRTDREAACPTLHETSFDPGGLAEWLRLPAINVERGTLRLPDAVSLEAGSFVEPLACVVRAQRLCGVRAGDRVAIVGSGLSGLLHLQLARFTGAERTMALDTRAERLAAAKRLGADEVFLAQEGSAPARSAERVLVCAAAPAAIELALRVVDDGGTVLLFAPLASGATLPLPMYELWKRGIALTHSYAGPPDDMRRALELIASGKIDVTSMITHRLPLAEAAEAFRLTAAGGAALKVIVQPHPVGTPEWHGE